MRFISLIFLVALLTIGSSLVADSPTPSPSGELGRIGVILPLSGPFARYGERTREGITKYQSDKVKFLFEDDGCDPKQAVSAYKKLSSVNSVRFFLGPACGTPQVAVAPLLKGGDQFALLGNAAPESVYALSGGRMFSTQHSLETESTFLARKLNGFGVKSVAIVFKENSFSRAHEAAFRAAFSGAVLETVAFDTDQVSTLKSISLRLRQLNPEALFIPDARPLLLGLMKELNTAGIGNKKVYSIYSIQSQDVLDVVGKLGEGIVYSYPDIGDEDALQYFPALAAKILAEAATACGDNTTCVRNKLTKDQKFDANGVLSGKLTLKTIKAGRFVPLSEALVSTAS